MEITLKITKKRIILILVVPLLIITSIYLYFFGGKPSDVSREIWLKGKEIYSIETGSKVISTDDEEEFRNWYIETQKFFYKHRDAHKGAITSNYSANEVSTILNTENVNKGWGYCAQRMNKRPLTRKSVRITKTA